MLSGIPFEILRNPLQTIYGVLLFECRTYIFRILNILYVHTRDVFAVANGTVRRIGTSVRRGTPVWPRNHVSRPCRHHCLPAGNHGWGNRPGLVVIASAGLRPPSSSHPCIDASAPRPRPPHASASGAVTWTSYRHWLTLRTCPGPCPCPAGRPRHTTVYRQSRTVTSGPPGVAGDGGAALAMGAVYSTAGAATCRQPNAGAGVAFPVLRPPNLQTMCSTRPARTGTGELEVGACRATRQIRSPGRSF